MTENSFGQLLQYNPDIYKDDTHSLGRRGVRRVLRAFQVDMDKLKTDIDASGMPAQLMIFADTLVFPDDFEMQLQHSRVVLFARRLQIGSDIRITVIPGADAQDGNYPFTIYTSASDLPDEYAMNVAIQSPMTEGDDAGDALTVYNLKEQLRSHGSIGLAFGIERNGIASVVTRSPRSYSGNTDLATLMQAQFQHAMTIYDSDRVTTDAILAWIEHVGRNWPPPLADGYDPVPDLYVQSASLRFVLAATSGDARYVPSLSNDVYADLVKGYYSAARAYEDKFIALSAADRVTRYQAAQTLLQVHEKADQIRFHDKLLAQTQENYDNARSAYEAVRHRLDNQKFEIELAKTEFEGNIANWKIEQIEQIVKEGITALIEFSAGVAALVMENPAGAGGAAKGVADAGAAVQKAAEAGKKAGEMQDTLKKLKALMEKIVALVKTTKDLVERSQKVANFAAGKAPLPDDPAVLPGAVPDSSIWKEFILTAESVLKPAIAAGIKGAGGYLDTLKIFAYQAQALANSQHNLIAIEQQWTRQRLEQHDSSRQLERLQTYVEQLQHEEAPLLAMMQLFYRRYLNLKYALFVALQYYTWAYFYEALKEPSVKLSMSISIADIDTTTTRLTEDYVRGLFPHAPPTDFGTIAIRYKPSFADDGTGHHIVHHSVPLTQQHFDLYDRVRLDSIWVYLEGAISKRTDEQIPVFISNTGTYRDRYKKEEFVFSSQKYEQLFTYIIDEDRKYGASHYERYHNVKDTRVEQQTAYAYLRPTPFAEWTLKVRPEDVDLSNVTEIVMVFKGSAIGHTS